MEQNSRSGGVPVSGRAQKYPYGYTCHFVRPGWVLPKRAESAR